MSLFLPIMRKNGLIYTQKGVPHHVAHPFCGHFSLEYILLYILERRGNVR